MERLTMGETKAPLSDAEADEMKVWVVAASGWGEAAQAFVGAATELATASRELADRLDRHGSPADQVSTSDGSLPAGLRLLAAAVEHDTQKLRDEYLATATSLEEYRSVLG